MFKVKDLKFCKGMQYFHISIPGKETLLLFVVIVSLIPLLACIDCMLASCELTANCQCYRFLHFFLNSLASKILQFTVFHEVNIVHVCVQ
jgi:hypothetical protein